MPPSLPISNLLSRKRRSTYDPTQDSPVAKRIMSNSAVRASNWDNLSKVWLTSGALRELDRRNDARPPATTSATPTSVAPTTLTQFSRRGGPDLHHLRRCPVPEHSARMRFNLSFASSSRQTQSTEATNVCFKAKRLSTYDTNFEQHLIEHGIYPAGYRHIDKPSKPRPKNFDDIVQRLSDHRASLSPSCFSALAFDDFQEANSQFNSELKVMVDILSTIRGNTDIPNEINLCFTNLDSITDGTTVNAVPNLYDGSYPHFIDKAVREDLSKMITPTSHEQAPVAPNFFVEVKSRRGLADVAQRQACLDGAVGARAMHCLQNYAQDEPEPIYDGHAHTFSSTYHAGTGTLHLYAHHVTGPTAEGERPEYHMTQLRAYALTSDRETFVRGAAAFRNARDLARQQREAFIRAANARASQARPAATAKDAGKTHEDNELSKEGKKTSNC